jgi:hypothetical protein
LETIYFTHPLTLLMIAVILLFHILSHFLKSPLWLTGINLFVHIAAIVFLVFADASLNDILCLLLISALAGLWQSGKEKHQ